MLTDRRTYALLALIVLVGAVLRFTNLGSQSLWLDEAVTWEQSHGTLDHLLRVTAEDNYPPLHNLLVFSFMRLFGDGEVAVRLPSALLGTANIIAIHALGAKLGGRLAGLLAALILALSAYHVWYSQEARAYALLACSATVFGWAALSFVTARGRARPWWLLSSGIALLYSHPFGTLTWFAIASSCVAMAVAPAYRMKLWGFLGTQAVTLVCFAPWALILFNRAASIKQQGFWIPYPTPLYVLNEYWKLLSGTYGMALVGVGLVAALVVAFRRPMRTTDGDQTAPGPLAAILFLAAWAFLPALLALGASVAIQPVFLARYLLGSLPAMMALAAIGLAAIGAGRWRAMAVALSCVALAGMSLRFQPPPPREDWRAVGEYLTRQAGPDDCIVVAPGYYSTPLRHYLTGDLPCFVAVGSMSELASIPADKGQIFLVLAPLNSDLQHDVAAALAATGRTATTHRFNSVDVEQFSH